MRSIYEKKTQIRFQANLLVDTPPAVLHTTKKPFVPSSFFTRILLPRRNILTMLSFVILLAIVATAAAFSPGVTNRRAVVVRSSSISSSAGDVEDYLAKNYPSCSALLAKNGDAMKKVIKADAGFTIFVPNEAAFAALGEKRRSQLDDIRNAEVRLLT